jgi:hypothetical protein
VVARVLPVAELAAAAGLLVSGWVRWGALLALVLFSVFTVAIVRSLVRGERPDCHCFGQLHSSPVGAGTLARNGLLLAAAAFVIGRGWSDAGISATAWTRHLSAGAWATAGVGLALAAGLAALGWVGLGLLRQHGRLLLRVDALETALRARRRAGCRPATRRRSSSCPGYPGSA